MTERLIVLSLVVTAAGWIFHRMWADIADVTDTVEFLDDDGLETVLLPVGWTSGEVWELLGEVAGLPEVGARV